MRLRLPYPMNRWPAPFVARCLPVVMSVLGKHRAVSQPRRGHQGAI